MRGVRRVSLFLLLLMPLALAGCESPRVFHCEADEQCGLGGTEGRCEKDDDGDETGYCSRPSSACASGWEYVDQSPDGLAGECVEGEGGGVDDGGDGDGDGSDGDGDGGPVGDADPGTPPDGCATALTAGSQHTCAATESGDIYCWGANGSLQLGSEGADSAEPRAVDRSGALDGGVEVAGIAAGELHTCAFEAGGDLRAFCWGDNDFAQIGAGIIGMPSLPRQVTGSSDVVGLAVGGRHSCTAMTYRSVYCWGDNRTGQVEFGLGPQVPVPHETLFFSEDIVHVAAGGSHSAAGRENGEVGTWGPEGAPALGRGTDAGSSPDQIVTDAFAAGALTGGELHTCGVGLDDGRLRCWGAGGDGQLGMAADEIFTPTEVLPELAAIDQIEAGGRHTCARTGQELVCFGDNGSGQLGAEGASGPEPRAIAGQWIDVAAGDSHTCARTATQAVYCWGNNNSGQLGPVGAVGESSSQPLLVSLPCE